MNLDLHTAEARVLRRDVDHHHEGASVLDVDGYLGAAGPHGRDMTARDQCGSQPLRAMKGSGVVTVDHHPKRERSTH